ncbi:uncharacterized protein LOC133032963 [Cannabis sativa]|uniref:uncharacterized protein LOC133032963 n=1 Tax=Cannabis sativa TaxID=3483 RepID=UPI0029C9D833|nr:uncharacterized protein LOC133032963 [Cannabis sativa]
MVREAFRTGVIDSRLNRTFICLIPKVEFPLSVDQFRPISLCNFSYKVIAKLLVNRLSPLMEDLITPFQSAFVPGRWIAESSILTQELIHKIQHKRGRGGLMAIKLDMHKAYDKMEWNFLDKVLLKNGLNESSRRLLMACVTSVSYSVLLNGCPLKKIIPQRGLRQGDPLSPFLFLLCQDVLSKLIVKAELVGSLHGISIAHSTPPISHLMFADDTILFSLANETGARKLLERLTTYENWSGQMCSKSKSGVLFSKNLSSAKKQSILNILKINPVSGNEKHLGNPFNFKRRKKEDYKTLKESMLKKLEGWKLKLLSYVGRLTLLKSVASSMPVYAMSTNKIPISSCRELDALMRKYWWLGNVEKDKFLALKAWDSICTPKSMGGLGLRRCEDMNRALLAKLAWSLATNKERPWVSYLLGKYCKFDSFWCVDQKNSDSYQWKSILQSREVIFKGSMATAASGNLINFWRQPWIPWLDYKDFVELMQQLRSRRFTVNTLADVSIRNAWNEKIILQIFGQEMGGRILQIPRIPSPFTDQIFWKHNQKGQFSVKEAYYVDQEWRFAQAKSIWKWIWDKGVHPRNSVFLWRILNEAIPTMNRLPFVSDKECSLCGKEGENAIHIFRDCGFTKAVWLGGYFPLRIDLIPGEDMISFLENLFADLSDFNRNNLINYVGCLCSEIWFQRNASCIRGIVADPSTALLKIDKAVLEIKNSVLSNGEAGIIFSLDPDTSAEQNSLVYPHQVGVNCLIYTDASWKKEAAGLAAVCVDKAQKRWFVKAQKSQATSALDAEFKAIQMALEWAISNGWQEILILSDSQLAVKALSSGGSSPDWSIASTFFSIVNLSKSFLICRFFFIDRTFNSFTDGVAKNARVSSIQDVLYQGEGVPPVIPITFST